MRVIVAEDSVLLRDGLVRLLTDEGIDVIAAVGDASSLVARVRADPPDVCVVDVRMPPTNTADGLVAATQLRKELPSVGMLILSQYVEPQYALELLDAGGDGVGYLLKERVSDPAEFVRQLRTVASGGTAIDSAVVTQLVNRPRKDDPLSSLSDRERDVLGAMAEGMTNAAISAELYMSEKTVESHIRSIFQKLGLHADPETNRRVLAVLQWLRRR